MIWLHTHTEYSLLDSILKIPQLVDRAVRSGMKAVGIADHGTLGGWVELYTECRKAGIKPIFGVEFYHSLTRESKENYHMTLFARTREGFDNIILLNNLANGNFYKKPRVTTEMLQEHGRGVIALSGCVQGYLSQSVLNGGFDVDFYDRMVKSFDTFMLEVMESGVPAQKTIYEAFRKTGKPMVATLDSHYADRKDAFAHEVSLGVMTNHRLSDPKRFKFNSDQYYLKTRDDMLQLFPVETVDASDLLADIVEQFDIGNSEWDLPKLEIDEKRELSELHFKLGDYLAMKFDLVGASTDTISEYEKRLDYEFKVIRDNGFLPYFKIVAGLCDYFDSQGLFRGWGRGSVSGSLVALLYGITKIDPIEWGLYFERFLNPDRITPPDIDLDFMPEHKSLAIEYLRDRYGEVYQIGNYGTLASREVIKSISRVMEYDTSLQDYVPKQAPVPTIAELLESNDTFREQASMEDPIFIDVLLKLEGLKRNFSTHASGVILASGVPLREHKAGVNKGQSVTVWDMYALEDLKFIKFDILGVTNLRVIDRVCHQVRIKVKDIPIDDKDTFEFIQGGHTVGIFQWESDGYRKLIRDLHPDDFGELLDLNTLYRPGCLESGITQQYIDRKFGHEQVTQLHSKIRLRTQGLPLYQEDIMSLARVLAGFTLSEADRLRKAIGKKIKGEFEPLRELWMAGCFTNGIVEREADDLWNKIEKFARYTWNKAHAVAYTLISWWTAYLSVHYPAEFLCELLNSADSVDRRRTILSECRIRKVGVLHPDIQRSTESAVVVDGKILLSLSGIKFVGEKTLQSIISNRPYVDRDDCAKRSKANKRQVEYLVKAGAFGDRPSLDDEREAIGYNISSRVIDQWWWGKYCRELGEIIDRHDIVTKKGDPMCFVKVEFDDHVGSVTVFPQQFQLYKDTLQKGRVGLFKTRGDGILQVFLEADAKHLGVEVQDMEGFLSFHSEFTGRANVFFDGSPISSIPMDDDMLRFIEQQFGIKRVLVC